MDSSVIIKIEPLDFPWQTQDPFIFCAYHRDEYPKGDLEMGVEHENLQGRNIGQDFTLKNGFRMYHGSHVPGFPYHPHRGFETITINKEGFVDHTDSLGAAGRFGAGDVQWMTAGRGVQHSEMFPLINEDKENPLEIFQIWLNLPKSSKMVDPNFKMLWKDMIPIHIEKDKHGNGIEIQIVTGDYLEVVAPKPTPDSWAAVPDHHVSILTVKLDANAEWEIPSSKHEVNRNLYFYKGKEINIDGSFIAEGHMIQLDPAQDTILKNGKDQSYLLMLQGKPIKEPVAKYGPFVMTTQTEIQEAFEDYRKTQFGGWPWPEREQVHERSKGRFAIHADGTEEIK